ncbi:hypothetical protein OH76DRAFT_1399683 [Lentinus brumalis]|uniref:CUE domain-containing protein n=1 Tax=Lentinus brumalis TaxID=2498619 RepID=A0A371DKM6_9APHY|nr:hypothetical protein OH76DRAFT_1399683 [Polyporus brumalis]
MPGEASSANALSPTPRPNLVRRETDQILSYYQSEHAGRPFDQYASAAPACELPSQSPTADAHSDPRSLPHTLQPSGSLSASDCADHAVRPQQPASVQPGRDHDLKLASPPTDPRARARVRYASTFSSGSDYSSQYSDSEEGAPVITPVATSSQFQVSTPRAGAGREARSDKPPHGHGDGARHSRRPSVPTEGGADRRRLAIVEMDPPAETPRSVGRKRSRGLDGKSLVDPSASSSAMGGGTLFSRRGVHIGGLALIAPPDASPKSYTNLTPPSTAPAIPGLSHVPPSAFAPSHTRSASEAVNAGRSRTHLHHKTSRDVGIVGLSSASTASESLSPASPTSDEYQIYAHTEGLGVPLFQTPAKSRAPSPGGATPELSDTSSASAFRSPHQRLLSTPIFGMEDGLVTPAIGESKDIRQPVVGPVIVGISPELLHGSQRATNVSAAARGYPFVQSPASSSSSHHPFPSQYLHYQPGVHATAGPLPPPPRSIFDRETAAPPRPPRHHTPLPPGVRRDIDAIKEALQLPQSVSAKLAARTPPESDKHLGREPSPPPAESSRDESRSQESAYSDESEPSIKLVSAQSAHVREGAFPPSKIIASPPGSHLSQSSSATSAERPPPRSDARPIVVIEQDETEDELHEVARRPALELRRESSWVSLGREMSQRDSSPNGKTASPPTLSVYRSPSSVSEASSSSSVSHLPSLPPKSVRHGSDEDRQNSSLAPSAFRALTNLKRFSSLPRTPSRSSRSSKRSTSPDARRSFSPPLPPIHIQSPPRRRVIPTPKYAHPWPPAMNPADVIVLRGARERARGYAMKINELSMYDCGLRDWLASQGRAPVSHPRTQSQRTAQQQVLSAVPAEFGGVAGQSRHVSHGSMASEMTFPIRADAYTATDLSARPGDAPTTAPPAILPYPALAQVQVQRAPARSSTILLSSTKTLQIPLSGTKGSGTGFFASLGRKTSVRRDKGGLLSTSPQSPAKVLTKLRPPIIASTQSNPAPSRPPLQPASPSIPGGPRAAPGRIQRAKTFSVGPNVQSASPPKTAPSPLSSESSASSRNNQRQSAAPSRRPSLFARARPGHSSVVPGGSRPMPVATSDANFQRQVDKLADLLPHADRTILAGYLRRAGEDILAIGQYLEDEKNGVLRRD